MKKNFVLVLMLGFGLSFAPVSLVQAGKNDGVFQNMAKVVLGVTAISGGAILAFCNSALGVITSSELPDQVIGGGTALFGLYETVDGLRGLGHKAFGKKTISQKALPIRSNNTQEESEEDFGSKTEEPYQIKTTRRLPDNFKLPEDKEKKEFSLPPIDNGRSPEPIEVTRKKPDYRLPGFNIK